MSARKARRLRIRIEAEAVLRRYRERLREIFRERAPEQVRRFPKMKRPCHTCAFNPATDDWQGWDSTLNNLRDAIDTDRPFYCHEPAGDLWKVPGWQPDAAMLEKMGLCVGYSIIAGDPRAKRAFHEAAIDVASGE